MEISKGIKACKKVETDVTHLKFNKKMTGKSFKYLSMVFAKIEQNKLMEKH